MPTLTTLAAQQLLDVVPLVMRSIRAEMRRHRLRDLSVPQFRTLTFLNRHAGASLSEAAEFLGLTLPSMSKLVDGLVDKGLVSRETHSGDRRRVTLSLTARGRTLLAAARASTLDALTQELAALDDDQLRTVVQAMQVLESVMAKQETRSLDGNT
jgi:DNA-binding MarR family transcriptional regulator